MLLLRKQTQYLWRNDFSSEDEFEKERKKYADQGFRVVAFLEGDSDAEFRDRIRALLENHWNYSAESAPNTHSL